ncbi:hypothetical protein WMY93_028579 [Mugilogobius chulae]|uniref:Uncharacterized protein n=1 Tax=Mugilogobius chulae TaxID=88201 RepID=A0AAW0MQN1_9GOBI
MLCESRLWSVIYSEGEEGCEEDVPSAAAHGSADVCRQGETIFIEHSSSPGPLKSPGALQSLDLERAWPDRQASPEMEIPAQAHSANDGPFLVPPSQWRHGSGRDRSFFLQGREGPFSNSLLNHYLEQKLQDLYQQYMMENMAKEDAQSGPMCPLLGSELVLTSLDQITLQLSKEGNLEAGVAKDMVLSCLLRVAGDMQSGEISTPFLQISNEGAASTGSKGIIKS